MYGAMQKSWIKVLLSLSCAFSFVPVAARSRVSSMNFALSNTLIWRTDLVLPCPPQFIDMMI